MKQNNKLVVALLIAGVTSAVFPATTSFADDANVESKEMIVDDVKTNETSDNLSLDSAQSSENNSNEDEKSINKKIEKDFFEFQDDEVTFPKNEKNTRESDGTNKFNRATETERETFGEDKNVTNIDPAVSKKLEETNGEYGKKDGAYANNNLKAITTDIKDVVVNPGRNENEVAITWFAKGDVNKDSRLIFDGKAYTPIRSRKTGDSNGYSTYTSLVSITPGKSYKYHVETGSYKSKEYTLKTKALGKNNEFNVSYFGDPQIGSGDSVWSAAGLDKNTQAKIEQDKVDFAKTLETAKKTDPHFFLSMGDNVEIAGYEAEYDYFLDNDMFRERIFSSVVGNHETYIDPEDSTQQNTTFSDHFYLPNESNLGSISRINEDGTPFYIPGDYYYTYGDTLFLNINSNVIDSNQHKAFIEQAIAQATKDHGKNFSWKVVSFHHAPYSTATHTSDVDILLRRKELVKIFNDNGIDVVLNGHDHIYARTGQMVAGEQALSFVDAYGTEPSDENAGIEKGFSKTYNNKIYKNGKVIVDGINLDYDKYEVTNPRGTMFLTMSTSAGSKYYNPIGEDQWFVVRSLDDRSQLFSNLTFSKNHFSLVTMDQSGKVVDRYRINKTDEFINNPNMNTTKVSNDKLEACINQAKNLKPISDNENVSLYVDAIQSAETVLNSKTASQEEVDAAIGALQTRLSSVEFIEENKDNIDNKENIADKTDNKADKNTTKVVDNKTSKKSKKVATTSIKAPKSNKKIASKSSNKIANKSNNPKTGIGALTGVYATLSLASAGLFASKKNKN
ncbi:MULTISPECIES: metallophosphoesterase [Anaerococcus]|nr:MULTISPECIES: metallophosphoesterase [Anaerococcus]MBP2070323.1 hypothetical protein [Anaerococcus nagyae]MDU1828896.1 metallophosphoesterase [Anaerococcus sp.]MDU1864798.1 metallophosphoesterase [Anaerococcus sp.]MDU2565848.1 metallophosphoesterase [Anaerococcus sp.]